MKQFVLLSGFAVALAATAGTIVLDSPNTVGVQKVTGADSEVAVPVPFEAIGGGDIDLASLVYIDNLATGDNLSVCANSQYGFYYVWSVVEEPSFCIYPSTQTGRAASVETPAAAEFTVKRGTGIKVNTTSPVYVMGQHVDALTPITTTVESGKRSYLVNPLDEAFDLDSKLTSGVDPFDDQIVIGSGDSKIIYYFKQNGEDGKHWYRIATTVENGKTKQTAVFDSPSIAPGGSFMYWRGGAGNLEFTWNPVPVESPAVDE